MSDSVLSLLESHIDSLNLNERFKVTKTGITNVATGSEFIFKGLKSNINSIKSMNDILFCWVEEAQSVSAESWKVLLPTIRSKGSRIIITANPEDEDAFLIQRWLRNPCENTKSIQVNYDKNPYFPQELENERQYALSLITSAPNEDAKRQAQADYDWIWEGQTKKILASQVIRRAEVKEFEWDGKSELHFGGDFGFSVDRNHFVRCFIKENDLYIDYEATGRCEIDELPQLIDTIPEIRKWPLWCDSARPETISALKRYGFRALSCEKWPGSVEDGISALNTFNRIYIHPRCPLLIEETRLYQYKIDRVSGMVLPILIDANNHGIDATRYALGPLIKQRGKGFFDVPSDNGKTAWAGVTSTSNGWF